MKHECPLMDLDIARSRLRWGIAALEALSIAVAVDDCFEQRKKEKEMKA